MGEYDRRQQKQQSRAIANSGGGSRQMKGFVDNRSSIVLQNKSIDFAQCNKADLLCKPCDNYSNTIQLSKYKYVCSTILKDKEGTPLANAKDISNGHDGDKVVEEIIDHSAFKSLLDGVYELEKWNKYHCAEPQSLAAALKNWRSQSPKLENPPVIASISKANDFSRYPAPKERCRNCKQWVPDEKDINAKV